MRQPMRRRAARTCRALAAGQGSRSVERDVQAVWRRLVVLQPLGKHTQCEGLHARHGLLAARAVRQDPGQIRYLRNPAAVGLALELDCVGHGSQSLM
jgi:hypothetical protein